MSRPISKRVYQATETSACSATSSRRNPFVRRRPPPSSPTSSGRSASRRAFKKRRSSDRRALSSGRTSVSVVASIVILSPHRKADFIAPAIETLYDRTHGDTKRCPHRYSWHRQDCTRARASLGPEGASGGLRVSITCTRTRVCRRNWLWDAWRGRCKRRRWSPSCASRRSLG